MRSLASCRRLKRKKASRKANSGFFGAASSFGKTVWCGSTIPKRTRCFTLFYDHVPPASVTLSLYFCRVLTWCPRLPGSIPVPRPVSPAIKTHAGPSTLSQNSTGSHLNVSSQQQVGHLRPSKAFPNPVASQPDASSQQVVGDTSTLRQAQLSCW